MIPAGNFTPEALSSLVDASAAINSAQGLDETLAAIARGAAAVMKAEASSVIILDAVRHKQVFRAAVGKSADRLIGEEYDEGDGISGKALETGEAIIVNNVGENANHYKTIDKLTSSETVSLIAAPLMHKGRKLGVIEVMNPVQDSSFTEADRELCLVFANLAAISTANADLYEQLQRENSGLKRALGGPKEMIGESKPMEKLKDVIKRVAGSTTTVLLLGETGTGKELAVRMIHDNSPRADKPFIAINCAAFPETLLESELFGHEAGAFTGATERKLGHFEVAHGGTIFLDEIGETPPPVQAKLLRVLENHEIIRLGGTQPIPCDVRVVAATNRDLTVEIEAKRFRQDLYYRLNVFPINIPPLRERREDIEPLTRHFIKRLAAEMKIPVPTVSKDAMSALSAHDYPGNIRELQNILERACILCSGPEEGQITSEHLPPELIGERREPVETSSLSGMEKSMIIEQLEKSGWNQTRAAKALGISRDNLRYRIKKYEIKQPE